MESRRTDDDTPLPEPPAELGAPSRPRRILQQEQLLWVMVAVAVAGSVMAIGSVHTVVLVPVAALAAASAIVAAPLRELGARDRAWPAPSLVFLGLALFTALQAVPLPMGVLKVIAPANADVWSRSLLPFDARPEWGSLSLDPGATVVESLKWLTYACTFFSATVLGARRGTQAVLAVVLGSATLLSVVTVAHGMVDAKKVFGLYEPSHSFLPHHIGPLLNSNNLAGYLNLGAITGAGLMLARRPILPVWVTGLCVSVDIAGTVRSGSRGGVAALILGVLLLALVLRAKSSKSRRVQRRAAPLILVTGAVVFGGALALLGGDVFVWRELFTDNAAKLKIVSWCAPLLREYGWLGVGRGAFETVFAAYRPSAGMHVVYTHPENFPAQWASEWGIPVALAALGSLAWMFRPGALGVRKSAVIAGAWVAVLALALQNLADLGFEIPAVGIATASVLGALWSDPVRKRGRERTLADRSLSRFGPRGFAMGTAVATGMLCVLALMAGRYDVSAQRESLHERFEQADDSPDQRPAFRALLREAMRMRPAEHYFPLLGATAAFRWKDEKPMPWLQLTLERAPVNGRAHALLAQVLASKGARAQALFELRLAVEHEPGLAEKTAPLATTLARTYDELLTAVPAGQPGAMVLNMMARELGKPAESDLRRQVDLEAVSRDPEMVEPRTRLLFGLFEEMESVVAGRGPGPSCPSADVCAAEIERHAAAIDKARPNAATGAMMRARGLIAQGRRAEAEALLVDGCTRLESRSDCLHLRAENLAELNDVPKLEAVLKELMSSNCMTAASCAAAATFVGHLRTKRNELHAAASAYMRAAQEEATEERWLLAADASERAKMYAQAIEALSHLSTMRNGADTAVNARISRLRAEAAAEQMRRF